MDQTSEIEADIRDWSRNVLEIPNPNLPNNMPACPYAKKAWLDNKVKVVEVDAIIYEMTQRVRTFTDSSYDLLILASFNLPSCILLWEIAEILNNIHAKDDIHVMVFHPEYGAEDADLDFLTDHEWESGIEQDYCMAFIQRLSQVDEASRRLEKLGYYEAFPEEDYHTLVVERRRRIRNGDETPVDDQR